MRCKYCAYRSILSGFFGAALLLLSGGCVPVGQEQWAGFSSDLLLNALAAFLL